MATTDKDKADGNVSPGSAQESGPLRGGKPVEPEPATQTRHPTPEAERRSEEVRQGGEPESRDDG